MTYEVKCLGIAAQVGVPARIVSAACAATLSHNGGQTYDGMLPETEKHGIVVSYDGEKTAF